MPVISLFAWMLVIAFLAFIACMFEDLESDIGSQSNPNSQIQLAPEMGYIHRYFNKAISGEGLSYALSCTISGTIAMLILLQFESVGPKAAILAIPVGAAVGSLVHMVRSSTCHVGREAAHKRFEQPIYLDVLYGHLLPIATHNFMAVICITAIAYIQCNLGILSGVIGASNPFPLPLLCLIWGLTVGAIGSSTGDIHYGTERAFQDKPFGEGRRVVYHGQICRYGDCGVRTSKDVASFCAKFGGPATGLAFGLIVLFENWRTVIGMLLGGLSIGGLANPAVAAAWGIGIGIGIAIVLVILARTLEKWARNKYGPFAGE
uniref:Tetrahydromethanopterin S-methyltransferase subunit E n=1 Tax=Candidatus Methanophagaceae archaeon ANME-1 ERB6 TaxID=2759912 RepID=A0A7G9YVL2_9EURY|nr:tetrahydromethanopterin S-methyltransferase subunit E [Methanosarcinales archaeon ANME-1 ERB6]